MRSLVPVRITAPVPGRSATVSMSALVDAGMQNTEPRIVEPSPPAPAGEPVVEMCEQVALPKQPLVR